MRESKNPTPSTSAADKVAFVSQLKGLATSQRRGRRAVFNTFEYFQLVSLLRQQHKITQHLSIDPDELSTWDEDTWESIQHQLRTYLESLFHLQKTSGLPRLPTREVDAHTADLLRTFGEPAYGGIFVDTIDGYADYHQIFIFSCRPIAGEYCTIGCQIVLSLVTTRTRTCALIIEQWVSRSLRRSFRWDPTISTHSSMA